MKDFIFLIDNGHGLDTPGKRSPDGRLREWKYNREIANQVVETLIDKGFKAELLVPEDYDVSLKERVRRANSHCDKVGKDNVIFVSVHVNAGSNGKWTTARGWSCYTSKGETKSDAIASIFYEVAEEIMPGVSFRKDFSDGDPDWEENFYVLRNTLCPAVLTESFFMDNKEDLKYLLSEEGKQNIVDLHVQSLIRYAENA